MQKNLKLKFISISLLILVPAPQQRADRFQQRPGLFRPRTTRRGRYDGGLPVAGVAAPRRFQQPPGRVRRQRDDGDGAVDAREHERQELEAAAQREGPDLLERHEGRHGAAVELIARKRVRGECSA